MSKRSRLLAKQDDLIKKVGLTVKLAQQFEFQLHMLIALLVRNDETSSFGEDLNAELFTLRKKTAGRLIHELGTLMEIPEEANWRLQEGLNARNYVMHTFFTAHITQMHVIDGLAEAELDLRQSATRIKEASIMIGRGIDKLITQSGFDLAAFNAEVLEQVTEQRGF